MSLMSRAAAILGLAMIGSLEAPLPADAQGGASQSACFCVKPTNNAYQPYRILRYSSSPACKATAYDPHGKAPWDNGIQSCDDATASAGVSQNRCFCAKPTSDPYQPYRIFTYPTMPACGSMTYRSNGKAPWDNHILSCADMAQCYKLTQQCKASTSKISKSMRAASEALGRCSTESCRTRAQKKMTELMQKLASVTAKCASGQFLH